MKVIFMGTPQFAVPTLEALIQDKTFDVVAVYTKPPKASGRGMNLIKSAVHNLADQHQIQVLTPHSLRGEDERKIIEKFSADVIVVAAYGLLLPKSVLDATQHGCINIHPSDLPRWRGAAPIQRTIFAGDKTTALCIMKMDENLDTGDVLMRHYVDIQPNTTATELEQIMSDLGAQKLIEALNLIRNNCAEYIKQTSTGITYAKKIDKQEEKINWDMEAQEILNQIRALSPKPGAYFLHNNEIIKIIDAISTQESQDQSTYKPGTVIDDQLTIACGSGYIRPLLLQRQGKKMIYTDAFLRGYSIKQFEILH